MGVWLYLRDASGVVTVPAFQEGGVLNARLTDAGELEPIPSVEAEVSITYNYSRVLRDIVPGFTDMVEFFHERRAGDMIPTLAAIVDTCGTCRDADYWQPTPGNAGAIMATILGWCRLHPDAVFAASG